MGKSSFGPGYASLAGACQRYNVAKWGSGAALVTPSLGEARTFSSPVLFDNFNFTRPSVYPERSDSPTSLRFPVATDRNPFFFIDLSAGP